LLVVIWKGKRGKGRGAAALKEGGKEKGNEGREKKKKSGDWGKKSDEFFESRRDSTRSRNGETLINDPIGLLLGLKRARRLKGKDEFLL